MKQDKKEKAAKTNKTEEKMALEKKIEEYRLELIKTSLFRFWSTRTSLVPICFLANALMTLIARGARRLNEMPCIALCRFTVYSRHTGSLLATISDPRKRIELLPPFLPC